jgi:hypothetical protein
MIKVMKGNPRLAREMDERQNEKSTLDNKQKRNANLVRHVEHSAHKRNDNQQRRDDCSHGRVEHRFVQ